MYEEREELGKGKREVEEEESRSLSLPLESRLDQSRGRLSAALYVLAQKKQREDLPFV